MPDSSVSRDRDPVVSPTPSSSASSNPSDDELPPFDPEEEILRGMYKGAEVVERFAAQAETREGRVTKSTSSSLVKPGR